MIKIAITGPESTGKSTLAEQLATQYGTVWVPEYARSYVGNLGRPYTLADIEAIARGQLALERELQQHAGQLLFADTDMLVLKIWSEHAFGQCPGWIEEQLQQQDYNLCLLMGVDLPWEPDPQREHPHLRQFFYDWYKRELEALEVPYVEITGQEQERLRLATQHVEALLQKHQPMLYFLENDNYKVGVDTLGAELHHFIKKDENLEFIWQADPEVWAGHAPNLFPIVGELPGQQYKFEGKKYDMKRHGFARRKEFELVEEHHDKLVFRLTEDEETLRQYPFRFRLLIAYTLEWNKLSVTYHVANTGDQALYFSIGGHPGFNVPFYPGEEYEDYYIEFEKDETLHRYLLSEDGLQNGDTEPVMEQERKLPLNRSYFYKDALVFKDVQSEKVVLGSPRNMRRVEVEFEGFPYLGIWGKPEHPRYVCIEPWCGIAGRVGESGDLTEKEGMNHLAPEQTFARTFTVTVL